LGIKPRPPHTAMSNECICLRRTFRVSAPASLSRMPHFRWRLEALALTAYSLCSGAKLRNARPGPNRADARGDEHQPRQHPRPAPSDGPVRNSLSFREVEADGVCCRTGERLHRRWRALWLFGLTARKDAVCCSPLRVSEPGAFGGAGHLFRHKRHLCRVGAGLVEKLVMVLLLVEVTSARSFLDLFIPSLPERTAKGSA